MVMTGICYQLLVGIINWNYLYGKMEKKLRWPLRLFFPYRKEAKRLFICVYK